MDGVDVGGSANLEQRVYDLFPPFPQSITVFTLIDRLNGFARMSVIEAVRRLKNRGIIENAPGTTQRIYRLAKAARRPVDMRGHHGNGGRRANQ